MKRVFLFLTFGALLSACGNSDLLHQSGGGESYYQHIQRTCVLDETGNNNYSFLCPSGVANPPTCHVVFSIGGPEDNIESSGAVSSDCPSN